MQIHIPGHIRSIKPYGPGKNIEEVKNETGLSEVVKMASNENPLGMSPAVSMEIKKCLATLNRYPDGGGNELAKKIAKKFNIEIKNIILGNGSGEIIHMLARAFLRENDEVVIPYPTFSMYEIAVQSCGAVPVFAPLDSFSINPDAIIKAVTPKTRMIFICNPNNPTGTIVTQDGFDYLLKNIPPDIIIVLDQAYIEFARDKDCANGIDYIESKNPVATLRTFSKIYGLAALRIGYGIMPGKMSEILNRIRPPFNTSSPAQAGACAALDDHDFLDRSKKLVCRGLDFFYDFFDKLGIKHIKSEANFILFDVENDVDSILQKLLFKGFIARSMTSAGLPGHLRVSMGTGPENEGFAKALKNALKQKT